MSRYFSSVLCVAVLSLLGWSCGSGESADGLPAPGTMALISVAPVTDAGADDGANLIANGTFGTWWAGAPSPQSYLMPTERFSRIRRKPGIIDAGFAAQQTWRKSDMDQAIEDLFHTRVELEAGTIYTLSVAVEKVSGQNPSIWIFEFDGSGQPIPVDTPLIKLGPSTGIYKQYIRSFAPKRSGLVVIAARSDGPSEVIWHEWRLTGND